MGIVSTWFGRKPTHFGDGLEVSGRLRAVLIGGAAAATWQVHVTDKGWARRCHSLVGDCGGHLAVGSLD